MESGSNKVNVNSSSSIWNIFIIELLIVSGQFKGCFSRCYGKSSVTISQKMEYEIF